MSANSKCRKVRVAALSLLMGIGTTFASAQTTQTMNVDLTAAPAAQDPEEARLRTFLDKRGGYKDRQGGYYNPRAGTYTDEYGGIVDNWGGYTYENGDYKSRNGDFWEAATRTFKLANGGVLKSDDTSNEDAVAVLRQTVEESGGYDKDLTAKSMMANIKADHPLVPATPK
jgi:hypothetical protein